LGTQQSGTLDLKLANLATDTALLAQIRTIAETIIESDPDLEDEPHKATAAYLAGTEAVGLAWSRVG
jgi:ATP-dependent DNA helicase RecG